MASQFFSAFTLKQLVKLFEEKDFKRADLNNFTYGQCEELPFELLTVQDLKQVLGKLDFSARDLRKSGMIETLKSILLDLFDPEDVDDQKQRAEDQEEKAEQPPVVEPSLEEPREQDFQHVVQGRNIAENLVDCLKQSCENTKAFVDHLRQMREEPKHFVQTSDFECFVALYHRRNDALVERVSKLEECVDRLMSELSEQKALNAELAKKLELSTVPLNSASQPQEVEGTDGDILGHAHSSNMKARKRLCERDLDALLVPEDEKLLNDFE